jgi:hypothetical protein
MEDLLTRTPLREAVPRAGVQITGARIVGDIDLENAKLTRPIKIVASRLEGAIDLSRGRTDSLIALGGLAAGWQQVTRAAGPTRSRSGIRHQSLLCGGGKITVRVSSRSPAT